jgi:serine/threonine protein phosphatase 1
VLGRLKAIFSGHANSNPSEHYETEPLPSETLYVIGDIHGCDSLLENAFERIAADQKERGAPEAPIILLGDYVDRGPKSAQVLERARARQQAAPETFVCILGNHEKMMLDFLDDPVERGGRWLRFGGVQTLESYGITGFKENSSPEALVDACDALEAALPEGMDSWLRSLPLQWQSGNVICVHAGMDPDRAPGSQESRVMLWGHVNFDKVMRDDGLWIVHGHTIVDHPRAAGGRISVDTGAYKTGHLSIAVISPNGCTFL